ncbi:dynein axonemal heavy chain 10-like [Uranotaenia lowii]|uniref:dynein axonemal heavy chain 10-like n=1 Tax=Uranotaenia lowii TaxID=190385 RepID=UPI00247B1180|nr:dynein axonemal heavy chain 10-like [Uranotaenia lowii]
MVVFREVVRSDKEMSPFTAQRERYHAVTKIGGGGDASQHEEVMEKRTALSHYLQLVTNLKDYEKDNFQEYSAFATRTVNSVLRRNILKLEFCEPIFELEQNKRSARMKKQQMDKKPRRPSALMAGADSNKYVNIATAVRWIVQRPDSVNPELSLAQKLVQASKNTSLSGSASGIQTPAAEFKIKQAHLMVSAVTQKSLPTWREVIGDSVLIEFKLKFGVNFSYDVFDVISEGQQFEYLGFTLGAAVRTAIMRKDQLFRDVEHVTKMVTGYNDIVLRLTAPEIHFLRIHLYEVETIIQAGLGRFTWQSFNIAEFCNRCQQHMKGLSSMVAQIGHITNDIKCCIDKLESFAMFEIDEDDAHRKAKERSAASEVVLKAPTLAKRSSMGGDDGAAGGSGGESNDIDEAEEGGAGAKQKKLRRVTIREEDAVKPCREYFAALEVDRNSKTGKLRKLYDSIGPILIKLESLVLGTFTGECEQMKYYYNYWEKQVFSCFTRFATRNLEKFMFDLQQETPLFEVDAVLAVPDILMKPSASEVYSTVINSVTDFLQRLKCFRRWMKETCLPCPDSVSKTDGTRTEPYTFTFFEDVVQIPRVGELVINLQQTIQNLVADVLVYLKRWRKYKNLWTFEKLSVCEKFLSQNLTLVRLDEKFIFYTQIVNDLERHSAHHDIKSVRINLQPLIRAIIDHAVEWRNTLGHILANRTRQRMVELNDHMQHLRTELDRNVKELSNFKSVMHTINVIQTTTLTVELKIHEMQEIYSILQEHRIKYEGWLNDITYKPDFAFSILL